MRALAPLLIVLAVLALLFSGLATHVGFFDRIFGKSEQASEKLVNDSVDQPGKEVSAEASLPEPSPAAFMLAAVHFRPQLLDDGDMLQRVLLTVHPGLQSVVSDADQWRKRKDELKEQLLTEAASPQLSFEIQPWRESSMSQSLPVELVKYDFGRKAYLVKFPRDEAFRVTPARLISQNGEPAAKYLDAIIWFYMDPVTGEQISRYFGQKKRIVYLHYWLHAVGMRSDNSDPTPVVEFESDRLELFALFSKPQDNQLHPGFKYLTRVMVPTKDVPSPKPAED